MLHFIENLQRKPEHTRRRSALLVAGCITLIIFLIWFSLLRAPHAPDEDGDAVSPSPFSLFKEKAIGVWESFERDTADD